MKLNDFKHTLYVLVGLPTSGKSTWVNANRQPDWVIISSDNIIDQYAAANHLTYNAAYKKYGELADAQCKEEFVRAVVARKTIVIDRTNLTVKSRLRWLSQVPKNYDRVAVIFNVTDSELAERNKIRQQQNGKLISHHIIKEMKDGYVLPSLSEGFTKIISA